MPTTNPPNADQVRKVVEERLHALEAIKGAQETVTIEWRGQQHHLPVISMPVDLLHFNPDTHRIRAQRSMDPALELELENSPFGEAAQNYLHKLSTPMQGSDHSKTPSGLRLQMASFPTELETKSR